MIQPWPDERTRRLRCGLPGHDRRTATEEKTNVIPHLGKHMADRAALVVQSAHGARLRVASWVPVSHRGARGHQVRWVRRAARHVLAMYHPDDEVINSVTVARKGEVSHANGVQNGHAHARGTVSVVSPPCKCCKMEVLALQKMEEITTAKLSY